MLQLDQTRRQEADRLFHLEYCGDPNFMTPDVLARGMIGGHAWEIASGTGFEHEPPFGVTVVDRGNPEQVPRRDLNGTFPNLQLAADHVLGLEDADEQD